MSDVTKELLAESDRDLDVEIEGQRQGQEAYFKELEDAFAERWGKKEGRKVEVEEGEVLEGQGTLRVKLDLEVSWCSDGVLAGDCVRLSES